MNLQKQYILLPSLFMTLLLGGCYKVVVFEEIIPEETEKILQINSVDGAVDRTDRFILFTLPADTIPAYSPMIRFYYYDSVRIDGMKINNDNVNHLGQVHTNFPYLVIGTNHEGVDTFQLIFTTLPVVNITTKGEIVDEPKVLSDISIQYCKESENDQAIYNFTSKAGIEIRGYNSAKFDKKSFGIELWKNENEDDYTTSLLGMRHCEDWILDAMYIDKMRMRNKLSFELWDKMNPYREENINTHVFQGIQCRYIELFINNRYSGIYCLNEKLDERLIHFTTNQFEKGGVLYKGISWGNGGTSFNTIESEPPSGYVWDGWELIYPEHDTVWDPLAQLRQCIVNSDDETFENKIGSLFDLDNAANYYLFVNLLLAYDNLGKNTYLARYTNQSRFYTIPWDIEASLGLFWDQTYTKTVGITFNHLFERLIENNVGNFNATVSERWIEYRNTIFSEESILNSVNSYYCLLKNNGAVERENERWDDINIDIEAEYEFMTSWIEARLEYLDRHFK